MHKTDGKKRSEVCPLCHRGFRDPRSLARHTKEVHAENSFECNVCGKFFPVKHSLVRHVQNVHHPTREGLRLKLVGELVTSKYAQH